MKIVFWGSDSFALPILDALITEHELRLVVCNPDKPYGRKLLFKAPETKLWAQDHGIAVSQPSHLKNDALVQSLKEQEADIFLVISYGRIMPQPLLIIPKLMSINLHASLLPELRGASPIQSAIWRGFNRTGVTFQRMVAKMDAGDILCQESLYIDPGWHTGALRQRLMELSQSMILPFLRNLRQGIIQPQPQDESKASYCSKILSGDMKIDWQLPAQQICNQIRALSPDIGAWTIWQSKKLKIWQAHTVLDETSQTKINPGQICVAYKDKFLVATSGGMVQIDFLQPENKRRMDAKSFINGFRPQVGGLLS